MSKKLGSIAEDFAIEYLQNLDYMILERNFYSRFGEIDIIALKDNVLHFVEVKSGKYDPIYQITPKKLSKIKKTAQFYLNKTKIDFDFCFDALIISQDIEFIENITI